MPFLCKMWYSSTSLTVYALRIETHRLDSKCIARLSQPTKGIVTGYRKKAITGVKTSERSPRQSGSKDEVKRANQWPTETSFYEIPIPVEFVRLKIQFEFSLWNDSILSNLLSYIKSNQNTKKEQLNDNQYNKQCDNKANKIALETAMVGINICIQIQQARHHCTSNFSVFW